MDFDADGETPPRDDSLDDKPDYECSPERSEQSDPSEELGVQSEAVALKEVDDKTSTDQIEDTGEDTELQTSGLTRDNVEVDDEWQKLFGDESMYDIYTTLVASEEAIDNLKRREADLQLELRAKREENRLLKDRLADAKSELRRFQAQPQHTLHLDEALNDEIDSLWRKIQDLEGQLKDSNDEKAALKFTPDSRLGKQLVSKCKQLAQENEELGKDRYEGRMHHLESEVAVCRWHIRTLKRSYQEAADLVTQLTSELERSQDVVASLRSEGLKRKRF